VQAVATRIRTVPGYFLLSRFRALMLLDPIPITMSALGGPSEAAPPSPPLEATISSINSNPNRSNAETLEQPAEEMAVDPEPAGPSTTYIPPQSYPPLPEFTRVNYPGHDYDSSDDEDEVESEMPIYITPSLCPDLNLFQYPLHHRSIAPPTWAKDRKKTITARIKEKAEGRVEIEVPVDEGNDVWRGEKARDMGFVMDVNDGEDVEGGTWGRNGKDPKKKKVEKAPEKWGDKMRLRSENVPNATHYFSGVIHDGL
jgi:DNA-directed RNA polymerase-3 subunit RPC5